MSKIIHNITKLLLWWFLTLSRGEGFIVRRKKFSLPSLLLKRKATSSWKTTTEETTYERIVDESDNQVLNNSFDRWLCYSFTASVFITPVFHCVQISNQTETWQRKFSVTFDRLSVKINRITASVIGEFRRRRIACLVLSRRLTTVVNITNFVALEIQ